MAGEALHGPVDGSAELINRTSAEHGEPHDLQGVRLTNHVRTLPGCGIRQLGQHVPAMPQRQGRHVVGGIAPRGQIPVQNARHSPTAPQNIRAREVTVIEGLFGCWQGLRPGNDVQSSTLLPRRQQRDDSLAQHRQPLGAPAEGVRFCEPPPQGLYVDLVDGVQQRPQFPSVARPHWMWLTLQPSGRDSDDIPVPHRAPERRRDIERQCRKMVHQRLGPKHLPRSVPITRNTNGCRLRERDHRAAPRLHQVETVPISRDTFPHQCGDGLVIGPGKTRSIGRRCRASPPRDRRPSASLRGPRGWPLGCNFGCKRGSQLLANRDIGVPSLTVLLPADTKDICPRLTHHQLVGDSSNLPRRHHGRLRGAQNKQSRVLSDCLKGHSFSRLGARVGDVEPPLGRIPRPPLRVVVLNLPLLLRLDNEPDCRGWRRSLHCCSREDIHVAVEGAKDLLVEIGLVPVLTEEPQLPQAASKVPETFELI